MAMGRCFRVFHKWVEGSPYSLILENSRRPDEFLLLESRVAATLLSADCADFRKPYVKIADAYGCLGILQLQDGGSGREYLVLVTGCANVGRIWDCDVYRISGITFVPMSPPNAAPTPGAQEAIAEISKLITSGGFFFAWSGKEGGTIDLSQNSQRRFEHAQKAHTPADISDKRFFWNRTLHLPLSRYGVRTEDWLLRCMCGGVEIKTVYVGAQQAKAVLISRLSCERMGTRFNVRGVNDDGHVANFVETEQVIFIDDEVSSFVQTRGSIPLFWEQPGMNVGAHKVKLSRGFEASAPAYDRHFKLLKHYYGDQIVVNLLGSKEGERTLSQAFKTAHENAGLSTPVPFVSFDYHAQVRVGNRVENLRHLWAATQETIYKHGFFHAKGDTILRTQSGTARTNCLDCLDRTNNVQTFFGFKVLEGQLSALSLLERPNIRGRFEEVYRTIWEANGNQCSRFYAGTGALDGKSKLKDAQRSLTRTVQNNLMDGSKQAAMDLFLLGTGLKDELYDHAAALLPVSMLHATPNMLTSLVERTDEFTIPQTLRLFCGTWNVNGGTMFDSVAFRGKQNLADWLLHLPHSGSNGKLVDLDNDLSTSTDIFAIGLEEIVDLNASNIMNASTSNQKKWGDALKKSINEGTGEKFILIHSQQLVGVCLFVFLKASLTPALRDMAVSTVATGMGGAGNKGGVAVRFRLHATSFCFVCSHFAAGQSHVKERNADFAEQMRRLEFPMSRHPIDHDYLFWLGDFNYRVDMKGDEVKELVRQGNFAPLHLEDQLRKEKEKGDTFANFFEGALDFAPTYKYDNFSDDYDTSEKCRTPAYTDRVLWHQRPALGGAPLAAPGPQCALIHYGRAELMTSDHRPVGGLWDVEIREVDEAKREAVFKNVVECKGPPDATVLVSALDGAGDKDPTFPLDIVDAVIAKVAELHVQILLIKFVGPDMWLIFDDGEMALTATSMNDCEVEGRRLRVSLNSPGWQAEMEAELTEATWLPSAFDGSALLADADAEVQDFEFDEEEVEPELMTVASTGKLGSSRPHSPGSASAWSGGSTPIGDDPNLQPKKPPPRPAAPPKRPPPPWRAAATPPPADPLKALNDAWGEEVVVFRQPPEGMVPIERPLTMPASLPHGVIGLPTDVRHQGAKSPEEATELMTKLYNTQLSAPPPAAKAPPSPDGWGDFTSSRTAPPPPPPAEPTPSALNIGRSSFYTGTDEFVTPAAPPADPPPKLPPNPPVPAPRRAGVGSPEGPTPKIPPRPSGYTVPTGPPPPIPTRRPPPMPPAQ